MKNNKLSFQIKCLFGNRIFLMGLSATIVFWCIYLSVLQIRIGEEAERRKQRMFYEIDIENEIDDLNKSYIENSDNIMECAKVYIEKYSIQYNETSDMYELFKDVTDSQVHWTSISMYIDEYMVDYDNWSDYKKNQEVTTMISLYKNYLINYTEMGNLILERETIYATIKELELLLEEEQ